MSSPEILIVLSGDYRGFALVLCGLKPRLSLEKIITGVVSIDKMKAALSSLLPPANPCYRPSCMETILLLDLPEQPKPAIKKFCNSWDGLRPEPAPDTNPDDMRWVLANALNQNEIIFNDAQARNRLDFELSEDDGNSDRVKSHLLRAMAIAVAFSLKKAPACITAFLRL